MNRTTHKYASDCTLTRQPSLPLRRTIFRAVLRLGAMGHALLRFVLLVCRNHLHTPCLPGWQMRSAIRPAHGLHHRTALGGSMSLGMARYYSMPGSSTALKPLASSLDFHDKLATSSSTVVAFHNEALNGVGANVQRGFILPEATKLRGRGLKTSTEALRLRRLSPGIHDLPIDLERRRNVGGCYEIQ
ncbi:hypothetical protein D3C77_510730 [compost metagenome]